MICVGLVRYLKVFELRFISGLLVWGLCASSAVRRERKTQMLHHFCIKIAANCPKQRSHRSAFLTRKVVHNIMQLVYKIIITNDNI